jgi:hypothetical protein
LEKHRDSASQVLQLEVLDISAIYEYVALCRIINSRD